MAYHGDIRLGKTLDFKFTTIDTSGAPITLAGSPAIAAYPDNSTTEITAGITLTVDFDTRTGLHNVRVVATSGNGYATTTNYDLVLTAGTVGGTSVVGYVVGSFSIENRSAVMPTTADRTLDVSAGGEAGLDWANIGSPTTVQNLSGTTVKTATDVETDTQDIQGRLPAALTAGGNMKSDAIAISGDTVAADNAEAFFDGTGYAGTNNVIPTVTSVTNQVTANATAISGDSTAADNLEAMLDGTGGVTLTTAVTGNITGNLSGSVGSVTGAVGSVTAAVTVGTNNDKTGYALTSGERDSVASALLDLTNGVETGVTLRQAQRLQTAVLAGKRSNSGTATEQFDAAGNPGTARVVGNLNASGDGTPTLSP